MRTLAVAAITGLVALALAGVASAAPSVSLVWTATTGSGTTGGSSISAAVGDTLTLDMLVNLDAAGTTGVALSYDISAAGVVNAYTRQFIDSINTTVLWDFQGTDGNTLAPSSATYTGGALAFISGSTCPAGALNNEFGFCGDPADGFGILTATQTGTDLGGGIIGSFGTAPGSMTGPYTFTIAQAVFEVVPEPATGSLLALGLGALAFIGRRRA